MCHLWYASHKFPRDHCTKETRLTSYLHPIDDSATPLQYSPLPPPYRPYRLVYIPPEIRHVQVTEQSPSLAHPMPETPRPFLILSDTGQFSPIQETPTNISLHTSPMGMPATVTKSLVGYSPSSVKRREPGVGETLMGCATLFLVGIILLSHSLLYRSVTALPGITHNSCTFNAYADTIKSTLVEENPTGVHFNLICCVLYMYSCLANFRSLEHGNVCETMG